MAAHRTAAHRLAPKPGRLLPLSIALILAGWTASLLVGAAVVAPSWLFHTAVAIRVISLTVSFGAVLLVDWHGFLWLLRMRGIHEMGRLEHAARPVIWGGLAGLLATGALLHPNLSSGITQLKLGCILVLMINGATLDPVVHQLHANPAETRFRDLRFATRVHMLASLSLSQLCWWTAIAVGFINTFKSG